MLSVGILVFEGVGILDFSGPYEVFSTAARVHARSGSMPGLFRCFLIATEMRTIRTQGGMRILPDCVLPPSPDIDVLIIPGGDMSKAIDDPILIDWIRASEAMDMVAIGNGAGLASKAGCGKVVTCPDARAAIETSLQLVERLAGRQLAHATANQIEYRWNAHDTNDSAPLAGSGLFSAA